MKKTCLRIARLVLIASPALAGAAHAASADAAHVPGHPRVNEVNRRIDYQERRIDAGVARGTITPAQAARDEQRETSIAQRASRDEARHGGHLAAGETRRLNHAENRTSRSIRRQKH